MALDPVDRLLLDPEPLTPAMLGLTSKTALAERLGMYLEIAGVTGQPTEQQRQQAIALVYGARIVVLEGEVEKFRREGKITVERDLLGRISRLATLRDAALALSQVTTGDLGATSFGPVIAPWGVEP